MALKDKSKLFAALERLRPSLYEGAVKEGLDHLFITDETYGPQSFIYVDVKPGDRAALAAELSAEGFVDNPNYNSHGCVMEIEVAYFKGQNCYE
jgi:hypothetical protein